MPAKFISMRADKLFFEFTNARFSQPNLDIKPNFTRNVRIPNDKPELRIVSLTIKIESTESEPKPFNLEIQCSQIYELTDISKEEERELIIKITRDLYSHIRNITCDISMQAGVQPIVLPLLTEELFPEDRDNNTGSVQL